MATGPTCSACPLADPSWPASEDWKAAKSSHARPSLRNALLRSTAHLGGLRLARRVAGGRAQALENVVAHAQRIGHDRQRRIYRRARWEEAAIHNVKILEIMGL